MQYQVANTCRSSKTMLVFESSIALGSLGTRSGQPRGAPDLISDWRHQIWVTFEYDIDDNDGLIMD